MNDKVLTPEQLNLSAALLKYRLKSAVGPIDIPVIIDDSTCRVLALIKSLPRTLSGGEQTVWLNGSQLNVKDLQLQVNLVYQKPSINSCSKKQKTQEDE